MHFGSLLHIGSVLLLIGIFAGVFMLLRRASGRAQRAVILAMMLVNVLQHLFKWLIYPQYWGTGFSAYATAYNMCAVLILLCPVAMLSKRRFLKNFMFVVGAVAGFGAIVIPVWYIGLPADQLGWDYARFYICHSLLFLSGALPLALRLHTPGYREFWQTGLCFIAALCLILLNDVIFISLGLFPGADPKDLYGSLMATNPCMLMGPQEGFEWIAKVVRYLSPPFLMGDNPTGRMVPILWYAMPLYVGISLISLVVFSIMDRRNLAKDMQNLKKLRNFKK